MRLQVAAPLPGHQSNERQLADVSHHKPHSAAVAFNDVDARAVESGDPEMCLSATAEYPYTGSGVTPCDTVINKERSI